MKGVREVFEAARASLKINQVSEEEVCGVVRRRRVHRPRRAELLAYVCGRLFGTVLECLPERVLVGS